MLSLRHILLVLLVGIWNVRISIEFVSQHILLMIPVLQGDIGFLRDQKFFFFEYQLQLNITAWGGEDTIFWCRTMLSLSSITIYVEYTGIETCQS
jgi:hypothetical protein